MWAKHSRPRLSKTQAGLHPFSPSVESWSCVALPLVRRVARVWHVSGVAREWPTSPLCHPTPETHPHLHPHFDALSPCPRPRPRPRPPWPHGHHYPTTTPPRSDDDHHLSTYYPVGRWWARHGVASVLKVSVRLISPLQTHGSTVTSVTTSLLCIAIRPRASKFGPCTCRGAAAQPPAAGDVAVHGGPVQYDKPQVRSTGRPSAPPVDSDQNQATGCQPARPAHPRMQAGVHHCVVHHCVAGARACPRRKSTRLKLSDSGCTLSPLAPLDARLMVCSAWYASAGVVERNGTTVLTPPRAGHMEPS